MIYTSEVTLQKAGAYLNRLAIAGATITAAQRQAVTALAKAIEGIGVSKFSALYPFLGGTAACHALDFMGGYPITWNGTPTHNADGVTGNGTDAYGDTGFNPSTAALPVDDCHVAVYAEGATGTGTSKFLLGASTSGSSNFLLLGWGISGAREVGLLAGASISEYVPAAANTVHEGLLAVTSNGSRSQQYYRDGSAVQGTVDSTGIMPSRNIVLLAANTGSIVSFDTRAMKFASIGGGLSSAQMLTLHTAVLAYQTALGRNV